MTNQEQNQDQKVEEQIIEEKEEVVTEVNPIDEMTIQLNEQKDRYLRLLAEYDNYRKRTAREMNDARVNAKISVISEFLTIFDYMTMAAEHAQAENANLETIRQGLQMIFSQYDNLLTNLGVNKIEAVGQNFNPEIHEAVSQEASSDIEAGKVIKQWKCGYKINDRLIRPATVVVSSGLAKKTEELVTEEEQNIEQE